MPKSCINGYKVKSAIIWSTINGLIWNLQKSMQPLLETTSDYDITTLNWIKHSKVRLYCHIADIFMIEILSFTSMDPYKVSELTII